MVDAGVTPRRPIRPLGLFACANGQYEMLHCDPVSTRKLNADAFTVDRTPRGPILDMEICKPEGFHHPVAMRIKECERGAVERRDE